jgi:hypothetical protein
MPLIKDIYDTVKKIEQDRIIDKSFIKSYGKIPVNNEKYEKLISYLERVNKQLQIKNPSPSQIGYQKMIEQQINLSRLKILDSHLLRSENTDKYADNILALLSYRNWCGIGTPIYTNIKNDYDNPAKMFEIDDICKNHDIAYLKSKTQEEMHEADKTMIHDIFQKYIYNYKKNFITGHYETDFTTWSSSYNTVLNYFWSLVETTFSGAIVYSSLKTVKEASQEASNIIPKLTRLTKDVSEYYNRIPTRRYEHVNPLKQVYKALTGNYAGNYGTTVYNRYGFSSLKNVAIKTGQILTTTIIRDKFLALITLGMMGLKVGLENLGLTFATPTEHEVSEKELNDIINNFELLQNLYLEQSNIEPIKIGNKWENEKEELITLSDLSKELFEIIDLDNKFNQTKVEVFKDLEPEIPTKEEQEEADKFYNKFITDVNKLTDIILEHNIKQEQEQKNEEKISRINNLKSFSDLISRELETPDIQKDIEENLENKLPIVEEEEEQEEEPEEEPKDEPEQKYKDEL